MTYRSLARRGLATLAGTVAAGSLVLSMQGAASAAPAALAAPARHVPGSTYKPVRETLKFGMHGAAVRALQQRLAHLHYFVGKIDGKFGWDTQEGVWAFKEVQTGKIVPPHPNRVDAQTQRWLVHPKAPRVLFPHRAPWRVEVNKYIEVLTVYKNDKLILITHVSSAAYCRGPHLQSCGWFTPYGTYSTEAYIPGKVADRSFGTSYMYWPVFFIGYTYAIHGFPNPIWGNRWYGVPLKPASHGCIRIPYDLSKYFHTLVHVSPTDGTPVYIYPDYGPPGPQIRLRPFEGS